MTHTSRRTLAALTASTALTLASACTTTDTPLATQPRTLAAGTSPIAPAAQGWVLAYYENFERLAPVAPSWTLDTYPPDGNYSDAGAFFTGRGVTPPVAYRATAPFGTSGWLTVEAYSRSSATPFSSVFNVVTDPANPANKVLRVASPLHTDATIIRPSVALPSRYRVCTRVGFADFGSGNSDPANLNGYLGGERSGPWTDDDVIQQNGFYWLTILDAVPRPHNNVWIHHHRKVTIDSDNNKESWTNIWNGAQYLANGEHPIMMFGIDKNGFEDEFIGKPFLSYANGALQPSGEIRAVDAYKDNSWYTSCIERNATQFVLTVSGDFKFGGQKTYSGAIPLSMVDKALTSPDWFMFGDPHNNWYRGTVYYDDVRLEVWK